MTESNEETNAIRSSEGSDQETIGAHSDSDNPALERDPSTWVSGGDPMTEAQKSYLDNLAKQAGEELPADMNKAEASQNIERLKEQTGN